MEPTPRVLRLFADSNFEIDVATLFGWRREAQAHSHRHALIDAYVDCTKASNKRINTIPVIENNHVSVTLEVAGICDDSREDRIDR